MEKGMEGIGWVETLVRNTFITAGNKQINEKLTVGFIYIVKLKASMVA